MKIKNQQNYSQPMAITNSNDFLNLNSVLKEFNCCLPGSTTNMGSNYIN